MCRFINADSILDIRGVNTANLYSYCVNSPVNNSDPSGHLFLGTIVGGIVGGIFGGLGALVNGESINAGIISGAITGAMIGYLGDNVISCGSTSIVAAAILYSGAAIIGNITNQLLNYLEDMENSNVNGYEYSNFEDYIDYGSVAISSLSAGLFVPVSMGSGNLIDSAFQGTNVEISQLIAKGISTTMFEINTSSLQMIAEGIIEIFFE